MSQQIAKSFTFRKVLRDRNLAENIKSDYTDTSGFVPWLLAKKPSSQYFRPLLFPVICWKIDTFHRAISDQMS